tara:strand:+ start:48 stop:581 length:534 start_codon:yes stop_codon:yes gene_type:complete
MDLDFLILIVGYLGIILFIHYNLKMGEQDISIPLPEEEATYSEEPTIDIRDTPMEMPEIDSGLTADIDSDLIIKSSELDNMKTDFNGDFMKYLEVEESNNNEVYRKLSDSLDINLDGQTQLDKYFKENNKKYTFEQVPTLSKEYTKKGIMSDAKELNDQQFGNVYAFDEFNPTFSTL